MKSENATRKIDSLGRVVLPKLTRQRTGLVEGVEVEVFTHEQDGVTYICLAKPSPKNLKNTLAGLRQVYDVDEIIEVLNELAAEN